MANPDNVNESPAERSRVKRRGRGEGGIERLPSGNWRAIHVLGRDAATRKRLRETKTFATKTEALEWLRVQQADQAGGPRLLRESPKTVVEWLDIWNATRKAKVSATTYADDVWRVKRHLKPRLEGIKFRDLTSLVIERLLTDMAEEGSSASERQKAGAVLRKALNGAVRLGLIRTSPMTGVKLPTPKRPEKTALSGVQVLAFVAAADAAGHGAMVRVWLDCGLRPSELFALEWRDFDAVVKTLFIRRALDEKSRALKEPKTNRSRRRLPLSDASAAALVAHRLAQKPNAKDLIFPDTEGGHWWASNFLRDVFRPIADAAQLPKTFTPYSCRHTMASLLLERRISVKVVSERLGHEDIQTTLKHYAHLMPGMQEEAAKVMGEVLSGTG